MKLLMLSKNHISHFLFVITFFLYPVKSFSIDRSPEVPSKKLNQKDLLCDIDQKKKEPNFELKLYIPILENLYNTNNIESEENREKIFCLLLNYYEKKDPEFAKEFKQDRPQSNCNKSE